MAISITNLAVSSTAPANAIIGVLALRNEAGANLTAHFQLTGNSAGFFYLSGNNLQTTRASLPPGFYSVRIDGTAVSIRWSTKGYFVIQVTN